MKKESNFNLKEFKRLILIGTEKKSTFITVSIVAILLAILSSIRPILMGDAIDEYIKPRNYELLLQLTLILCVILLAEIVLNYFFILLSNIIAQTVIEKLRVDLFNKIIEYKLGFFDRTPNGTLVTRSVSDIETVSQVFTDGILVILGDILKIIFIVIAMFSVNWKMAIIVIVILPIMVLITKFFQKKIKTTFAAERTQTARFNSFVQERLSGIKIIQLFGREQAEYKKFKAINDDLRKAYIATIFYFSILFPVVNVISSMALGLIIIMAGYSTLQNHDISAGHVIAFIMFIPMLVRPIRQIAERFNNLQRGLVSSERVFKMIDLNETFENEGTHAPEVVNGNIEFKDVVFEYIPGEEVLKGISFSAKQGETIAIVGATGAGKSTIINLLSRFYDIKSGSILIDGVDVRDFEIKNLRRHIAVVLQDVFLFNDSILNNITLNDPTVTRESVIQAARDIEIEEFISSLPGGFDYQVAERGNTLSVGQRQLISFLRAYIYQPDILVLDEATSSIDTASEHLIQHATDRVTADRTSIIIAHRLATIQKADTILVMDKGRIVERGTHQELLTKKGYYYRLHNAQFKDA
ncbi:MAG: ABC transporter ATP-binding protein [Weeksellaceae bacterium]